MRHLAALGLAVLAALPLVSCYTPDIPSGKFSCRADEDCPGVLVCRAVSGKGQRCVDPAPGGDDMASGSVEGCKGEGVKLSDSVFACRGSFSKAGDLCQPGMFRLCEGADMSKLQLGDACTSLQGFFVTAQRGRVADAPMNAYDIDCGKPSDLPFGLLGCGTEDGARVAGKKDGGCLPTTTVLRCDRTDRWDCGFSTVSYDGKGGGGALCCRR